MLPPLGYSDFKNVDVIPNKSTVAQKSGTRKRQHRSSRVETFLNSMESLDKEETKDDSRRGGDSDLANFEPIPRGELTQQVTRHHTKGRPTADPPTPDDDAAVTGETFNQLPGGSDRSQYYNPHVPSYGGTPAYVPYYGRQGMENSQGATQGPRAGNIDDHLMKKLNYLIHLLEDQRDEDSGNVTEELILYVFLGVFVIFVVDSFARAAKYTR